MKYQVNTSNIHGVGIIATISIPADVTLGIYLSTIRTNARRVLWEESVMTEKWFEIGDTGRYMNHQTNSNTNILLIGVNIIITSKGITIGEEITVDYNQISAICKFPLDTKNFIEL